MKWTLSEGKHNSTSRHAGLVIVVVVAVAVVVVILTFTGRHTRVRGHTTGSNNST